MPLKSLVLIVDHEVAVRMSRTARFHVSNARIDVCSADNDVDDRAVLPLLTSVVSFNEYFNLGRQLFCRRVYD